jgi:hypothetical protein
VRFLAWRTTNSTGWPNFAGPTSPAGPIKKKRKWSKLYRPSDSIQRPQIILPPTISKSYLFLSCRRTDRPLLSSPPPTWSPPHHRRPTAPSSLGHDGGRCSSVGSRTPTRGGWIGGLKTKTTTLGKFN